MCMVAQTGKAFRKRSQTCSVASCARSSRRKGPRICISTYYLSRLKSIGDDWWNPWRGMELPSNSETTYLGSNSTVSQAKV